MAARAKKKAERRPYVLPVGVVYRGRPVAAGEELLLFPDTIERIEAVARAQQAEEKSREG